MEKNKSLYLKEVCCNWMEQKSLISTGPEYFHSTKPCSVQLVFLFKQAFTPECWNRSDFDAFLCVWKNSKNKKSTFPPSLNLSGVFMRKRTLTWARDGCWLLHVICVESISRVKWFPEFNRCLWNHWLFPAYKEEWQCAKLTAHDVISCHNTLNLILSICNTVNNASNTTHHNSPALTARR